jgi:GPH family glycoside/pentoside/hexuronide:cation symporter
MTEQSSEDKDEIEKAFFRPKKKQEIGFAFSAFFILLFGLWGNLQFYAVTVLLIPLYFIPIIYLIYSIVDGFNDPLIGYYTDRSKRFTAKYGKRYPWIVIGGILGPIPLILAFIPIVTIDSSTTAIIIAVIWLTTMMCLWETFATTREVSHEALFPDLFRYDDQRSTVQGIIMLFTVIAQLLAAVSVPLIIASLGGATKPIAFIGAALFVIIITYIVLIPYAIWGVKETEEMKQIRIKLDHQFKETEHVKKVVSRILRDRNWMGLTFAFLLWGIGGLCFSAGMTYFILHYLGLGIEAMVLPGLLALGLAVIAIPFWVKIARMLGARVTQILGLIASAIVYLAFFFVIDYTGAVIVFGLMGISYSANWGIAFRMAQATALDNASAKNGKREEASFVGILRVFSAFVYFFQSLIFVIVWTMTGYAPEKRANQTELAKFGLKLNMSLIPFAITLIAIIIFAVLYTITKETATLNKKKLAQMGL